MSTKDDDVVARVREALAEDGRTNALDVKVSVGPEGVLLEGIVETEDRHEVIEKVARAAAPLGVRIRNYTRAVSYEIRPRPTPVGALRVAAVGDTHVGEDSTGLLRLRLTAIGEHADVLLLAGDLTQRGRVSEARVLAGDLCELPVPIVAVLGNHDYHDGAQDEIRAVLEDAGVTVLDGSSVTLSLRGRTLGVAGVKGFGSGFAGACGSEFGEPEMKAYVRHAKDEAEKLERALAGLETDVRIALTHYAPVADTLEGERLEVFPFLGSYLLGEAIDAAGADLALHGHAHRGCERGVTPAGVPVRNVAQHVICEAYRVYRVEARAALTVQPLPT